MTGYWLQHRAYDGAVWERHEPDPYPTALDALERRDELTAEHHRHYPAGLSRFRVVTADGRVVDYEPGEGGTR